MPLPSFLRANRRLQIALGCYLILILIALYALLPARTSHERFVLGFVLCFLAILMVKTIARAAQDRNSE
jgi:hypothetical protein